MRLPNLTPEDWVEIYSSSSQGDVLDTKIGPDGETMAFSTRAYSLAVLSAEDFKEFLESVHLKANHIEDGLYDEYEGEVRKRGSETERWLRHMRRIEQKLIAYVSAKCGCELGECTCELQAPCAFCLVAEQKAARRFNRLSETNSEIPELIARNSAESIRKGKVSRRHQKELREAYQKAGRIVGKP